VPAPRDGNPDSVLVPRGLADDMAAAINAMQVLAAETMLEVAMSLGLAAKRPRTPAAPPCATCGVDVGVGNPHLKVCASEEASRLRTQAVPKIVI
jgi:hypothetical protein